MAENPKDRNPASVLHLGKEMANKLFIQPPKSSIKPPNRNPITQEDLDIPEGPKHRAPEFLYAAPKSQGIKMGTFADKSKKSDIFGAAEDNCKVSRKYIPHSSSETFIPTVSLKKSEYQPPARNPITQDTISPYNPQIRTKCSESTAFSHLFDQKSEEHKPRKNI